MAKKIPTNQLVPGMYVVNTGVSWRDNPYLFSTEGPLSSAAISKLLQDGYLEVFIDPDRSVPDSANSAEAVESTFGESVQDMEVQDFEPPVTSLAAEMPAAKEAYVNAIEMSKIFMDGIRRGDSVELYKAKGPVEGIISSVNRNPDALLSLCKLRDLDEYTYSHSVNVSVLAVMFAKHMSFTHKVLFEVGMAGMFHDLGKAMVPIELLNAPRELSEEEFTILRRHPRLGYEHVKKTPGFTQDILLGIYDHHERFDGSGYPRGVSGDKISLTGRILAMMDVYDALSSRRPYKLAMLPHKVLGIMYQMRFTDFYPGFMEQFIRMLGIYPVGSVVEVEGGFIGIVTSSNKAKPTKPKVLLVQTVDNKNIQPNEIDTGEDGAPSITRCLGEGERPFDPGKILNVR